MTNLNYQQTHFVMSAPDIRHLPSDTGIEVAFAGRSNAGKSSALNTLTNQKSLARTSKTPALRPTLSNQKQPNTINTENSAVYTLFISKGRSYSMVTKTMFTNAIMLFL